jgi:hypothetical protein
LPIAHCGVDEERNDLQKAMSWTISIDKSNENRISDVERGASTNVEAFHSTVSPSFSATRVRALVETEKLFGYNGGLDEPVLIDKLVD